MTTMKTVISAIYIFCLMACTDSGNRQKISSIPLSADTVTKLDTAKIINDRDWQINFGLTHDPATDSVWGKPVKFYIENPNCSPIAADFYKGRFRPTDDDTTENLLKLVTTDDKILRPFYRWCLSRTIQIEDGALAEETGIPARSYAEKFPDEFFTYMDSDRTNNEYNKWINSISYCGFYEIDDYKKPQKIRTNLTSKMKQNCVGCSESTLRRIDRFAKDCFP